MIEKTYVKPQHIQVQTLYRRSSFWVIALLLITFGMNACRSHKKAQTSARIETEGAAFYTSCYPIESLWVPSCKLEITIGPHSYSLNGNIYIRSDSICYFSGKWLLFEIRGAIYRDSFIVVNYFGRVCYQGKNEDLQKITGYPVNPESLMMLFTADRCEDAWRNKLKYTIAAGSNNRILMQGENRSRLEMSLNTKNRTVQEIVMYNSQQRQPVFSATYSSYDPYPQFVLPTVFDISAHVEENPIRIKASFREVLFNQPKQVNIRIPSQYKVITL